VEARFRFRPLPRYSNRARPSRRTGVVAGSSAESNRRSMPSRSPRAIERACNLDESEQSFLFRRKYPPSLMSCRITFRSRRIIFLSHEKEELLCSTHASPSITERLKSARRVLAAKSRLRIALRYRPLLRKSVKTCKRERDP